jgi:hypothetical protein
MPTVMAAVVRGRRTFSDGATARVVGDVGCGRDGPPRPFGCRAVMIAHERAPGRLVVVGPACQWQMQPPAINVHDAWFGECGSPRSINPRRGRGKSLTSSLSTAAPCFLPLLPGCTPFHFRSPLASSSRAATNYNGSPSQSWCSICCRGPVRR